LDCVGLDREQTTMILFLVVQSQNSSSLPAMLLTLRVWLMEVVIPVSLNTLVILELEAIKILMMNPSGS
jgi:hypothetical protein